jgi:5'-nucleotidase
MNAHLKPRLRLSALSLSLSLLLAGCIGLPSAVPRGIVDVELVAVNDFHGNLEASKFGHDGASAGGVATLGAALQAWRQTDPQLLLIGGGDLIGASPALSSMWADEPSLVALSMLGMQASSVGNHEFDAGRLELLRQQNGGCNSPRPSQACQLAPSYAGAGFTYLAANVIDHASGQPFMPAYRIVESNGIKIGLIGAVLKGTSKVVLASGIAGLDFIDEAEAINRTLPALRAQGVGVFVALIHEGGRTDESFDQLDCARLQGPIVDIVQRLDPAIALVVSGHTHQGYTCRVDGKLVTQAGSAAQMVSRIRLKIDTDKNAVQGVTARNVVMTPGEYPADIKLDAYLATLKQRSTALLERPVAQIAVASVTRSANDAGESALGKLIADATLEATRQFGATIALMNNGGMRRDLEANAAADGGDGDGDGDDGDGDDDDGGLATGFITTVGQVKAVLPFGNTLVVMSLSGAQLRSLLEQQWPNEQAGARGVLQVSNGFNYMWDASKPVGARLIRASVDGVALQDATIYRIAVNNFLAEGGDNFSVLANGSERIDTGIRDIDALQDYLRVQEKTGTVGKPDGSSQARIVRIK